MPFDKEKAKRNLKEILEKFNSDTDITLLHEYYKLYKKEVSLFKRSWAAAWLFMYYDKRETPNFRNENRVTEDRQRPRERSPQEPVEIINIPEEESKMLFISIGKNRRLFPREVITLIMTKTSTPREDIGVIRILDNYSFVQVRDTKAEEIITSLTGFKFRGRTLTVNYAKPKNSEDDSSK